MVEGNSLAIELNRDNYESEILQAKGTVLIDFWGEQCVPCKALLPTVEQLEKEFAGRLKVGKVNAPQNRMLCARLRVLGLPTFIIYKDGIENKRLTGERIMPNELKAAVEAMFA
jgi:thioredoxin 1